MCSLFTNTLKTLPHLLIGWLHCYDLNTYLNNQILLCHTINTVKCVLIQYCIQKMCLSK